jgi:hypothetical protein
VNCDNPAITLSVDFAAAPIMPTLGSTYYFSGLDDGYPAGCYTVTGVDTSPIINWVPPILGPYINCDQCAAANP